MPGCTLARQSTIGDQIVHACTSGRQAGTQVCVELNQTFNFKANNYYCSFKRILCASCVLPFCILYFFRSVPWNIPHIQPALIIGTLISGWCVNWSGYICETSVKYECAEELQINNCVSIQLVCNVAMCIELACKNQTCVDNPVILSVKSYYMTD